MSQGKLSENAKLIAEKRYFIEGEDWEACANRVGMTIASVEGTKVSEYASKFSEMIFNLDFLPGGRILRNSGRPSGSLFNCYFVPIGDSTEEIGLFYNHCFVLWCKGGGVGVNISPLRPEGSLIKTSGGFASGPVSFLAAADGVAKTVEIGGQRRAAALALMHVEHPDIMKFIDAKMIHGVLPHFNISVAVDDEFLVAVETDSEWELKFAHKTYAKVPARDIWNKIMDNMIRSAEPGLINWNNMIKNNSYYYDPVQGTNPCGEAVLSPYDVCDLGSLVLPSFITGTVNTNWKKLEDTIKLAVRFLDDVVDVNKYFLKENDIKAHNSRRIGVGVMGLAEYLFAKGLRYGSEKALNEVEKLMQFIRNAVYEALIGLADEKGSFQKFNPVDYGKASFIRKLPAPLRMAIKEHGVRCVTGMAIAPTGTISLVAGVNSSIEPLFAKAYLRSDRVSDRMYVHPIYKKLLESGGEVPDWFVDSYDLKPADHFAIQAMVQKYVDGAVSKTINLPKGATTDDLSKLTLEWIHDVKGVTVYVDGSREGQVLNTVSDSEVRQFLKDDNVKTSADEESVKCATGSCEI
jgi:ribonucleoside-diphosphate reductase alpha chain